ncbi:hypothetical protein CRG98_029513 [Punica granatum]|uniref:Uncharacterized protein n=1 Tax=Punica granatum TaxID=22663 RepID=A0A2I0J1F8_PUNGR|nr:hypothetical protein CRG98_029513 [Punica granatum]
MASHPSSKEGFLGSLLHLSVQQLTSHFPNSFSSLRHSTERCPIWNSKNPSQCQSDQRHVRAHFGSIPLKLGRLRSLTDAFSDGAPGGPTHSQVNGTPKRTYRHPGTTGVVERVSDDLSELYGAPRMTFQW